MATAASTTSRGSSAAGTPVPTAPAPGTNGGDSSASNRSSNVPNGRSLAVSASVGHDNWASDVLSAVHVNEAISENGEKPPDEVNQLDPVVQQDEPVDPATAVARLVAEKKRKFHSGRMLELKNLPDGCTEQVRKKVF
jgi:hypothetical protein